MISKSKSSHWFLWQKGVYARSSMPRRANRAVTGASGASISFCTNSLQMKQRLRIARLRANGAATARVCHREGVRKCGAGRILDFGFWIAGMGYDQASGLALDEPQKHREALVHRVLTPSLGHSPFRQSKIQNPKSKIQNQATPHYNINCPPLISIISPSR